MEQRQYGTRASPRASLQGTDRLAPGLFGAVGRWQLGEWRLAGRTGGRGKGEFILSQQKGNFFASRARPRSMSELTKEKLLQYVKKQKIAAKKQEAEIALLRQENEGV
jgi:hypothetical protein